MLAGRSPGSTNCACACDNSCSSGGLVNNSASASSKRDGSHPSRLRLLLLPQCQPGRKPGAPRPRSVLGGKPFLCACSSKQAAQNNASHPIHSPKIGSPHGMRNELHVSSEVALDGSSWHNWLRHEVELAPHRQKASWEEREVAGSRQGFFALLI